MEYLASAFRYLQLCAHNAHNLTSGETFFQDHSFFGELYGKYEDEYDSLIERMIGLGKKPDLVKIQKEAVEELGEFKDVKSELNSILEYEKMICKYVEKLIGDSTEGTKQLLGEIANQSEMRQYKIQQRIK